MRASYSMTVEELLKQHEIQNIVLENGAKVGNSHGGFNMQVRLRRHIARLRNIEAFLSDLDGCSSHIF